AGRRAGLDPPPRAIPAPTPVHGGAAVAGRDPPCVDPRGAVAGRDPPYNRGMNSIRPYRDIFPALGARVYIDPDASVVGDVELGDDVSLCPQAVDRGDVNFVRIGARTNLQDGTVIHVSHDGPHAKLGGFATVIGEDVTIGHKAIIHACRI